MRPDLRQRLANLLLDIPQFESEAARRPLLRTIFCRHAIWLDLQLEGAPAAVIERLLDLCDRDGEAVSLLLSGLRGISASHPERLAEIDELSAKLCRATVRRRQLWNRGAPFRGLHYFDREHAPIFFGRDAELRALFRTMATEQGRRFCVVFGESGAGKSSLVRAGVWARLADGKVREFPGSERWLIAAMKPDDSRGGFLDSLRVALKRALEDNDAIAAQLPSDWRKIIEAIDRIPLAELAARLLRDVPDSRWLILLDQMEELFAPEKSEEGAAFLDRLIEATAPGSGTPPVQVLATLRTDFFHHCHNHPPLKHLVQRVGSTFPLGCPDRLALEHMVSGPLTELELPAAWILDPDLPPAIAGDAERRPGGLALMAFALRELYDACSTNRVMDLETYRSEAFGGLGGAIARRADATLATLGEESEAVLRRVFARLVRVSGEDEPVRQREELAAWDGDPAARRLVDAFVDARLLVTGRAETEQPVVEVAHEALLREWPKLAAWINERRDDFRLADHVRTEARAWAGSYLEKQHRRTWHGDVIDNHRERLAGAGLLDRLLTDPNTARLLTAERDWILEELDREGITNQRRWEIGVRLDEIGDTRPGVGLKEGLPDIIWCPIPGGRVEIEKHGWFDVEPFQIAAYPVTHTQFRAFLHAEDGYRTERWWEGFERKESDSHWERAPGNHPATSVSWYDAVAFCRWLSTKLGLPIRLPHEKEWQWAAQSAEPHFEYPWGGWMDGRANTAETGISKPAAVGVFPAQSRQGVFDLSGNVWEWCVNERGKPRDAQTSSAEPRVLRGGSWFNHQGLARSGYRFNGLPFDRSNFLGFRVVCSSPIRRSLDH